MQNQTYCLILEQVSLYDLQDRVDIYRILHIYMIRFPPNVCTLARSKAFLGRLVAIESLCYCGVMETDVTSFDVALLVVAVADDDVMNGDDGVA